MNLQCYSRLNLLLTAQDMTIPELRRKLEERGVHTNVKSLYRLNDPLASVEKIDAKIAGQICDLLGIDLSALFGFREKLDLTRINHFPVDKQRRLDELLSKNREGHLNEEEKRELSDLIEEAEALMMANARALAMQRRSLGKAKSKPKAGSKKRGAIGRSHR